MKVQKTLEDVLKDEGSIDDVLATLRELAADLRNNPEDWENPSLDRYLEAMEAWLQAVRERVGERPSWRLVATMLEASKVYE